MAARVYRPGFLFCFTLALLCGLAVLWSVLVVLVAGVVAIYGYVSIRLDERGVTRTHFGKREFFAWEDIRAVTEVAPPPGSKNNRPHWEVTGRRARVLFCFGIMLGRREQFIADLEAELLKHRELRIEQARAKADG